MKSLHEKIQSFFTSAKESGSINATIHGRATSFRKEATSLGNFAKMVAASVVLIAAVTGVHASFDKETSSTSNFAQTTEQSPFSQERFKGMALADTGGGGAGRIEGRSIKYKEHLAEIKSGQGVAITQRAAPELNPLSLESKAINEMMSSAEIIRDSLSETCDLTPATIRDSAKISCMTHHGPKGIQEVNQLSFKIGESHGLPVYIDNMGGEGFGAVNNISSDGEPVQFAIFLNRAFLNAIQKIPEGPEIRKSVVDFAIDRAAIMSRMAAADSDVIEKSETFAQFSEAVDMQAIDNLMNDGFSAREVMEIVKYAYVVEDLYIEESGLMDQSQKDDLMSFFNTKFEKASELTSDREGLRLREYSQNNYGGPSSGGE